MTDVLVVAGVAGFFALAWAFVGACARLTGTDRPLAAPGTDTGADPAAVPAP